MGTSSAESAAAPIFCSECGRPSAPDNVVRFGSNAVCAECKPRYVQQLKEGALPAAGVEYGGFWRRVVAVLIDGLILAIVLFPLSIFFGQLAVTGKGGTSSQPNLGYLGLLYALTLLISVGYYAYFLSQKSATPGKMVMHLRVLTAGGARLSIGRAVGRYFATFLSALILYIGYIMAAFDSEKRALHDYICSTRVTHTI